MKVSVFLKYPHHVLITFILQSQIINHNIYINSSSHDPQWVSYRYLDKRKSPINGLFTPFMKLCLLFKLRFEFVICHDFPTLFIKNTTFYTELSTMSPLSPNKNHHLPTTDLIHHHLDNRSPESQTTAASVLLFPRPNSISYHLPQTDMKHHQEFQL